MTARLKMFVACYNVIEFWNTSRILVLVAFCFNISFCVPCHIFPMFLAFSNILALRQLVVKCNLNNIFVLFVAFYRNSVAFEILVAFRNNVVLCNSPHISLTL